jgi:hypothetical protein
MNLYKNCPHKIIKGGGGQSKAFCDQFIEYNLLCQPEYGCSCPVVNAKRGQIKKTGKRKPPTWSFLIEKLLQGKLKRI